MNFPSFKSSARHILSWHPEKYAKNHTRCHFDKDSWGIGRRVIHIILKTAYQLPVIWLIAELFEKTIAFVSLIRNKRQQLPLLPEKAIIAIAKCGTNFSLREVCKHWNQTLIKPEAQREIYKAIYQQCTSTVSQERTQFILLQLAASKVAHLPPQFIVQAFFQDQYRRIEFLRENYSYCQSFPKGSVKYFGMNCFRKTEQWIKDENLLNFTSLLDSQATPRIVIPKGLSPSNIRKWMKSNSHLLRMCKKLDLVSNSYSCMTEVPPEIGYFNQLRELTMTGQRITELPPEMGNLSELRELWLNFNTLLSLPVEMKNLNSLTGLMLYECHYLKLPEELSKIPFFSETFNKQLLGKQEKIIDSRVRTVNKIEKFLGEYYWKD